MSGLELAAIVGLIASTITLIDRANPVYADIEDANELPETFRRVYKRLPTIVDSLEDISNNIRHDQTDEVYREMRGIITDCKGKAEEIENIFEKVTKRKDDSFWKRSAKVFKLYREGDVVEMLAKHMIADVQLLSESQAVKATKEEVKNGLVEATPDVELKSPEPSVGASDAIRYSGSDYQRYQFISAGPFMIPLPAARESQ